jgi:hypothetical protein
VADLTIEEAAAIAGRSVHTVYRWKRNGVDITNRAELLSYGQSQDARGRGKAYQNSRRRQLAALYAAQGASELQSRFSGVTDPEEFVELRAPFSLESAKRVIALLREIRAGFLERAEELKRIGHTLSISLAGAELEEITEVYRRLDNLFEGFADYEG